MFNKIKCNPVGNKQFATGKKYVLLSGVFLASLFVCNPAGATGAVAGATEPTQIMNNFQLVAGYAEQLQQTTTQIQQYQTMLRNLVQMTPSQILDQASQKLWVDQNMAKTFKSLRRIVVAGQSTSYTLANIDQQFKSLHPGYNGFSKDFNFGSAYRNWSDTSLDSIKNAMAVVSAHGEDFDNEADMMSELAGKSQTAQGQMQVLQAGNQVGIATVGQLQKLRQLQMAQMQAQNNFMAGQESKATASDELFKQFMTRKTKKVRTIEEINASRGAK